METRGPRADNCRQNASKSGSPQGDDQICGWEVSPKNGGVPSGELTYQLKMAIEIVDFPIKNGDFPWQNVSSPEGTPNHPSHERPQLGIHWSRLKHLKPMVTWGSTILRNPHLHPCVSVYSHLLCFFAGKKSLAIYSYPVVLAARDLLD